MDTITGLMQNGGAWIIGALGVLIVALIITIARTGRGAAALRERLSGIEREMKAELKDLEGKSERQARMGREELAQSLRGMSDSVTGMMGEMTRTQQSQLDAFAGKLNEINGIDERRMDAMRQTVEGKLTAYQDRMDRIGDVLNDQLGKNDQRVESLRRSVEQRMEALQQDNALRLGQIERTVDERLNTTIDRRLNESFQLVNERLERVYQGLGEMQTLASGVGDLKRVLTDVRARGLVGEIQLGALLSQMMTREQYETDVRIKPDGGRVGFAVVLPGRASGETSCLLPIDASFPHELYDQLIDAHDRGDAYQQERLSDQLAEAVREAAVHVADQFIDVPRTTDFAVLFLGSEGLYAEALRHPGLVEGLQRECRVTLAGPSTLSALLTSIQMGIKTLQIERRSEEVWSLLGAVRGEMGNFADALSRTQKRIRQASESIEDAAQQSRRIRKRLKGVDKLSADERKRLGVGASDADDKAYEHSDWD